MRDQSRLCAIKTAHTIIWVFFASCVAGIPVAAWQGRFALAAWLVGFVALECAVLAFNAGRCPLQGLAAPYTSDRSANFDIYLPAWLAGRTMIIFGPLFACGVVFAAWRWAGAP